jgi:sulfur carrier protein
MRLFINGQTEEIDRVATVQELVRLKNLPDGQVVLEVNGEVISREHWPNAILHPEDKVEILRFVGGG